MAVRRTMQPVDETSALDRQLRLLASWARLAPVEDPPLRRTRPVDPRLEDRRPHETTDHAWKRVRKRLDELGRLEAGDRYLAHMDRERSRRPYA